MPNAPEIPASLLLEFFDRSSRERREQTEAFERALGELRRDFRLFGAMMLGGLMALAGVNVAVDAGAFSFQRAEAKTPTNIAVPKPDDFGNFYDAPEVVAPVSK